MPRPRALRSRLRLGAALAGLGLLPLACGYIGPNLTEGQSAGVDGSGGKVKNEGTGGTETEGDSGGTANDGGSGGTGGGQQQASGGRSFFGGASGFGGENGDTFFGTCTTCACGSEETGYRCQFSCAASADACRPICSGGSDCHTDVAASSQVVISCEEGSTCYAGGSTRETVKYECNGNGDCHVSCGDASSCGLTCTGPGKCTLDCGNATECALNCNDQKECQLIGSDNLFCTDDVVVCGDGAQCRSSCDF